MIDENNEKNINVSLGHCLKDTIYFVEIPPPVNWVGGLEKGLSKHIKNECPYPPIIINHANIGN